MRKYRKYLSIAINLKHKEENSSRKERGGKQYRNSLLKSSPRMLLV